MTKIKDDVSSEYVYDLSRSENTREQTASKGQVNAKMPCPRSGSLIRWTRTVWPTWILPISWGVIRIYCFLSEALAVSIIIFILMRRLTASMKTSNSSKNGQKEEHICMCTDLGNEEGSQLHPKVRAINRSWRMIFLHHSATVDLCPSLVWPFDHQFEPNSRL